MRVEFRQFNQVFYNSARYLKPACPLVQAKDLFIFAGAFPGFPVSPNFEICGQRGLFQAGMEFLDGNGDRERLRDPVLINRIRLAIPAKAQVSFFSQLEAYPLKLSLGQRAQRSQTLLLELDPIGK
ncbi:MAG: hypothetical protein UZ16_OP3001003412 [Candidatus Hinthialibacteria bacterium OLB16]|nr:MAG: hypothetical protein UZ16_OP3001003412 [Candidatus Hinthialibacteria bacterium OLB16]